MFAIGNPLPVVPTQVGMIPNDGQMSVKPLSSPYAGRDDSICHNVLPPEMM